jgi:hypothetical protein
MNRYNFNNLKNLIPVNSMAVVISILALFVAVSSGSTPCLSADSVCSSGVDPEYTNNLSVKAGTTNKATITHNNLNGDNQYFFPESNYSRTSSVAVLKKGSDQLNILDLQNGSIIVGQSQTTTVGALRVQTSSLPVLQLYGSAGWQDVGASTPQNVFTTISGNSGSLTASTTTTSIKLEASADSGLTVVASGDKLEIQSSGGGGYSPQCSYYAYTSSNYTPTNPDGLDLDTELYDFDNCYTLSSNSAGSTITYTDSTTRVFNAFYQFNYNRQGTGHKLKYSIGFAVGRNQPSSPTVFAQQWSQNSTGNRTLEAVQGLSTICLEQNKEFALEFQTWDNNNPGVTGGRQYTYIMLNELPELSAVAQSNGCSNGLIN